MKKDIEKHLLELEKEFEKSRVGSVDYCSLRDLIQLNKEVLKCFGNT